MDIETIKCQRLAKAIILQSMKDTILPFGVQNNYQCCRSAFNFLFNERSSSYQDFCYWCNLADIDSSYWQRLALMNLAYEMSVKPWLRRRIVDFLRGEKNWKMLKEYYDQCVSDEGDKNA